MTENIKYKIPPHLPLGKGGQRGGVAFLWDESFLWGLMAHKALKDLGLPFDLIRAEDVRAGVLNDYKMLFVPGGWASNKSRALGEIGVMAIRNFVSDGGNYLGFCGGAGLATKAKDGMGLLNVMRRPTSERVPSFSGRIELNVNEHPIWNGIKEAISLQPSAFSKQPTINFNPMIPVFHAWWPSQFIAGESGVNVLATYGSALPDSFSSDLNVGDTGANGGWKALEDVYKINLDPARLAGEPSIIEGGCGKGKVILSLVHFDTPDDMNGQRMLINLWGHLGGCKPGQTDNSACLFTRPAWTEDGLCSLLLGRCSDLIALGERNFLWFWRNPMLLQWRRGVRGLEYNTLYIMMKEISGLIASGGKGEEPYARSLENIKGLIVPFIEKAKRLIVLERHAMQKGHITYEKCDDPEIKEIRTELFSDSKSHGGTFKALIDEIDTLLFTLIGRRPVDE